MLRPPSPPLARRLPCGRPCELPSQLVTPLCRLRPPPLPADLWPPSRLGPERVSSRPPCACAWWCSMRTDARDTCRVHRWPCHAFCLALPHRAPASYIRRRHPVLPIAVCPSRSPVISPLSRPDSPPLCRCAHLLSRARALTAPKEGLLSSAKSSRSRRCSAGNTPTSRNNKVATPARTQTLRLICEHRSALVILDGLHGTVLAAWFLPVKYSCTWGIPCNPQVE
mmetsp:Transcript_21120/g.55604  ORF Transcript_21120/g.55604 Transcript_21120/m.55604 type:complete len:225 (-) Transcript_21120:106-780(-)